MRWMPTLLISLFVGGSGAASVVEIWTETSLRFTNLGSAEASATATGLATIHASSATSSHLATLTLPPLSLLSTVPVAEPEGVITAAVFDLRWRPDLQGGGVIGNVSGAIAGTGTLTPDTIPITGNVAFCLLIAPFPPCVAQLDVPLGATRTGQRIGAGVGGAFTFGDPGTAVVSVVGAPFTVATVSVPFRTTNGGFDVVVERGFAHGPASLTSSTATTSGVVQVVTPIRIVDIDPGFADDIWGISRTRVHVVPEPALFLLFGGGAAAVALLGRRRR